MSAIIDTKVLALAERLDLRVAGVERVSGLLRVVEELRIRGYVIVLKWDGERNSEAENNGPYTAIVSGGNLAGEFFRRDDETLEGALEYVLSRYEEWERTR